MSKGGVMASKGKNSRLRSEAMEEKKKKKRGTGRKARKEIRRQEMQRQGLL